MKKGFCIALLLILSLYLFNKDDVINSKLERTCQDIAYQLYPDAEITNIITRTKIYHSPEEVLRKENPEKKEFDEYSYEAQKNHLLISYSYGETFERRHVNIELSNHTKNTENKEFLSCQYRTSFGYENQRLRLQTIRYKNKDYYASTILFYLKEKPSQLLWDENISIKASYRDRINLILNFFKSSIGI